MLKKILILQLLLFNFLFSKDCADYFNPNKFYETPLYLQELIEENIENLGVSLFDIKKEYKKLNFTNTKNTFIKDDSFFTLKEYLYPIKSQLWKYKTKNKKVIEVDISKSEYYKLAEEEIANEINENFEQFWNDWNEDGYTMQLLPTHTLFSYKEYYFALSVFVYGFKGDASSLEKTVVNYHLKNYTKEVNTYIKCMK